MFGKIKKIALGHFALSIFLSVFLLGCADPHYVQAQQPPEGGGRKEALMPCHAQFHSGICVSLEWETQPADDSFGSFIFKTFRQTEPGGEVGNDNTPIFEDLGNRVSVLLWMPSMGHGSSPVRVERLEPGVYRASQVYFSMRGSWEIRFQIKEENKLVDQANYAIEI